MKMIKADYRTMMSLPIFTLLLLAPLIGAPNNDSFIMSSSSSQAAKSQQQTQRDDQISRCHDLLQAEKYGEARALFNSILINNPKDDEALLYVGRIFFYEKDFKSAITWIEKAVTIQPDNSDYHYWLARANEQQFQETSIISKMKYAKKFRDEIKLAVALDGSNLDARFWLMRYYLTSPKSFGGNWDSTLAQAAIIKQMDPEYGYHAYIEAYQKAKMFDHVERVLRERITHFSDKIEYQIDLSWFLLDHKRYDEAMQNSKAIIKSHPDVWMPFLQIGRAAAESKTQLELGKDFLEKYIENVQRESLPYSEWAHFYLGQIFEHDGDFKDARSEYSKAQESHPDFKPAIDAVKNLKDNNKASD